jgi:S-methylmethionine-dependent homocysteine/selenocysteine methylase
MTIPTSSIWPDLDTPVVTDGGLETWPLFHHDVELPAFAAYPLVDDERGRALLTDYYERYLDIAAAHDAAALLEAPTWRANPDWGRTLGHDRDELGRFIDASMTLMSDLRSRRDGSRPILVSAVIGPRGDGYRVGTAMDPDEAAEYHGFQIDRSARAGGAPNHYMINCAHPSHFASAIRGGATWTRRIGGLRANASMLSHAELDERTSPPGTSRFATRCLRSR